MGKGFLKLYTWIKIDVIECTSKGGTASGTCASSFGVCCVFSISCGATSSANNSYAVMSSYSVSSDADPCTYTFCKGRPNKILKTMEKVHVPFQSPDP